jgi:hypothetical protein
MRVEATERAVVPPDGDWLTRARVRGYAVLLLVLELAIFSFFIAGTHGWIVPLGGPTTTDFVSFYTAGSLADAGTPALAYDHAAHLAAEEAVVGRGIEYQFFNYPPVYQAIFALLAYLPYLVAFVLFIAATLLLYLAVARRILDDYSGTALLALLAFPAVWWTIGLGQNAFLTAGLFGAATLLIDRQPVVAGLLFGALCYKPHFALLVPIALAAGGHWRAFAAAAASAAALAVLSLALFGWETWQAFLETAAVSHSMYESGRILFGGIVSPFGAVRLIGGSVALAYIVQTGFSLFAAGVVFVVWRQNTSLPARAAILASATLVAIPLALLYDLMLATIAACWLLRRDARNPLLGWEKLVLAATYPAMLGCRGLIEKWPVPIATICALAMFAIATRHAWLELNHAPLWRRGAA